MSDSQYSRWVMVKNLIVFQVKLAFDAFRDLPLSPVSFVCALIDIIKKNDEENSQFKQLMNIGKQTDTWLNLFGQHNELSRPVDAVQSDESTRQSTTLNKVKHSLPETNVDQIFDKIEVLLKEQQVSGKLTSGAREKLYQYLDKIQNDNYRASPKASSENTKNN